MRTYDVVIKGGQVVDGTGGPARPDDVGIVGDRIAEVGRIDPAEAVRVIAADGRVVAPGFIDIHTHSDIGILQDPAAENMVRQGVTTNVTGNCGGSSAPIAEATRPLAESQFPDYGHPVTHDWSTFGGYLDAVDRAGVGINVAPLVGHGTVRLAVLGYERRPPTAGELASMRAHVDEAMRAGAFGMSTGLVYPPGCFGDTDEVVALAEIVAGYDGLYASHIRGERETVVDAVRECLEIGERSGCRTQISHNAPKHGGSHLLPDVMALWEDARDRGLDVAVDNDAHTDLAWELRFGLPQWTHELPARELLAMLASQDRRTELIHETVEDLVPAYGPTGLLRHGTWDRIWLLPGPTAGADIGRTVAEIADERGLDGWTTYLDLIVASGGGAMGLFDYIELEVVEAVARHPMVMLCSDGWVLPKGANIADPPLYMPCSYGEFPGMLERFVVRKPVLTLEQAIHKMTGMPASRVRLPDRGRIAPGTAADLVVLDLARVRDRATNLFPHRPITEHFPHGFPEGVDEVLVNGQAVVSGGEPTGAVAGRVLRRTGRRP
ncbi:MAG: N-acyl-D-amino-acid deacylase family protein [Actinomycetota bacterium]